MGIWILRIYLRVVDKDFLLETTYYGSQGEAMKYANEAGYTKRFGKHLIYWEDNPRERLWSFATLHYRIPDVKN